MVQKVFPWPPESLQVDSFGSPGVCGYVTVSVITEWAALIRFKQYLSSWSWVARPCEWPHDLPLHGLNTIGVRDAGGWMQAFVAQSHARLTPELTSWISGLGHWSLIGWHSSLGLQMLSHQPQRCPWSSRPQHWEQSELPTPQLYTSTRWIWQIRERHRGNYYCEKTLLNSDCLDWST